jgi:hypothetical protein
VRERAGGKCERCELLPMLACHLVTYERKYREQLDDLQAICQPCHDFTHAKSDFDPEKNARFIRWLAMHSEVPWLHPTWKESFLEEVVSFPTLICVLQMWVAFCFEENGAQETVDAYAEYKNQDGEMVEDAGAIPTRAQLHYVDTLQPAEKSFYSWLRWNGPSQYPIGDKSAFARCVELADALRKKE